MNKEEYLRIIKKGIKKVDAKEKEDILNAPYPGWNGTN